MASGMKEWFEDKGGSLHPSVRIDRHDADGKGYRLLRSEIPPDWSTQADQVIVHLPYSICLSILKIPDIASWWPTDWIDKQNPTALTRFLLVECYAQEKESLFYPYVKSLPSPTQEKPFQTPLYWSNSDLAIIQGSNLFQASLNRQEQWMREFEVATKDLLSMCPESREHLCQYTYDIYKWAATVITSRCFPGRLLDPLRLEGLSKDRNDRVQFENSIHYKDWLAGKPEFSFPVLLPILDFANHDPAAVVTWKSGNEAVELVTSLPAEIDAEIYNNYGQKSNEELILGYGFDLPENVANHVGLALPVGNSAKINLLVEARDQYDRENPSQDARSLGLNFPQVGSAIYALRANVHPLASPAATPLSILAMNTRELLKQAENPRELPNIAGKRFPSRLGVVCAVQFFGKLRQQYNRIAIHDENLPDEEAISASHILQMGKRYRDSQLSILREGITGCSQTLAKWAKTGRMLSLEDLVSRFLPSSMLREYRHWVHRALGTRNAEKIQARGHEELAFVLWLMVVLKSASESFADMDDDIPSQGSISKYQLSIWLNSLFAGYGVPGMEASEKQRTVEALCWTGTIQAMFKETATSYLETIRQSGLSDEPDFANFKLHLHGEKSDVDLAHVMIWALRVIREELVSVPSNTLIGSGGFGLDDAAHEKSLLVFEDDAD